MSINELISRINAFGWLAEEKDGRIFIENQPHTVESATDFLAELTGWD